MKHSNPLRQRRWFKILVTVLVICILLTLGSIVVVRQAYHESLKPINANQTPVLVTVPPGSTLREIAQMLKQNDLIREPWAFEWYVNSQDARDRLQAGTYSLRPNQSVQTIVGIMAQGKIETDLVLIAPGKRLDEIKSDLINSGFDVSSVERALDPALYKNHPALVDKPQNASLEGYLYPESFQKDAQTKPEDIIRQSLDEMQERLTPELRNRIVAQGLTMYEGIILASVIEKEVSEPEDKKQVAQVFLKRLKSDIALESDATALYGAFLDDQPASVTYESTYNTYTHKRLPPSPISNVSVSSLEAVANPADTDWLFFVSGDDDITYFSKTIEEHESLVNQHCKKKCGN